MTDDSLQQSLIDIILMGLLPDTKYCALRMRQECRERFPRHQLQMKPLVSYPSMHHGTCETLMTCNYLFILG